MQSHDIPSLPADIRGEFDVIEYSTNRGHETWLLRDVATGAVYALQPQIVLLEVRTGAMMYRSNSPPARVQIR